MKLFQGYNTWAGQPASTIADGENTDADPSIVDRVILCSDNMQLFQSLEVDASVSGSYGGFSADAKSKFFKSLSLTTNSITLLVYVSTQHTNDATKVSIDQDVEKTLTDPAAISQFVKKNGDSWVSSVTVGTFYAAAFVFYCETKEQKTKVQASLSGEYTGAGVKASASVGTDIAKTLKETKVRCKVYHTIGGFEGGSLPTPLPAIKATDPAGSAQAIMDYAVGFPSMKTDVPAVIGYTVQGYETAFDTNVDFQTVVDNRRLFNGSGSHPGWGRSIQDLMQLANKISDMKDFYAFYGVAPDADLSAKGTQVDADQDSLVKLVEAVSDAPAQKSAATPELVSLGYGAPQPDIKFVDVPPWGNVGSTNAPAFDDVSTDMVYGRIRIEEISVTAGDRLDNLKVSYNLGGRSLDPKVHGGTGGGPKGDISLSGKTTPPEMVEMIQAYGGDWPKTSAVNRIWIKTTKGQQIKTVHPDGADKDHIKNHPSAGAWTYQPGGDVLVGFKGKADKGLVIMLQAIVVSFNPTQWVKV